MRLLRKEPTTIGGHLRKRRLQLGIFQSEGARQLRVSTVTLSKWERDVLYPAWVNQPKVTDYLGFNLFTDPAPGRPFGNERVPVVLISSFGYQFRQQRIALGLSRKVLAEQLGISWKTIWGWENNRRNPSPKLKARLEQLLKLGESKETFSIPANPQVEFTKQSRHDKIILIMPMENQSMPLPELPSHLPQIAEKSSDIPQDSVEFRSMPNDAEEFGKIPHGAERKENHTLTVREVRACLNRQMWRGQSAALPTGVSPTVRGLHFWTVITIQTNANTISRRRVWRRQFKRKSNGQRNR